MYAAASAPGKLLLLGDHAVVYNHPCLVTAVDIRYDAAVQRTESSVLEISTPELKQRGETHCISIYQVGQIYRRETAFVEAAVAQVQQRYGIRSGLKINTSGPARSYGLGSSSAVTVATLAALDSVFELGLSRRDLFSAGYQAVLDVQGIGSGFDVAAAVFGGTLYYVTGGLEIEPLHAIDLPFVVGYSGTKVGTVDLVKSVAEQRRRFPVLIDRIFAVIHDIVDAGRSSLIERDWNALGELMDIHQGMLEALGVSTAKLSALIYAARRAGAYGAKLSGAGGGDCMFAVAPTSYKPLVEQAIADSGGELIRLPLGVEGVRVL